MKKHKSKKIPAASEPKPENCINVNVNGSRRIDVCLESIKAINKIMDIVKEDFVNVTISDVTINSSKTGICIQSTNNNPITVKNTSYLNNSHEE